MYNTFNTIDDVRHTIEGLEGQNVDFEINKGRGKIVKVNAQITRAYPSLFTIQPNNEIELDRTSYSYCDVICGEIKF